MIKSTHTSRPTRLLNSNWIISGLFGLAVLLTIWQLVVASNLATKGDYMSLAESRIRAIKAQNLKLQEEILRRQSLTYLMAVAKARGYSPTKKYVYLHSGPQAVAALPLQP